jgi:hypothetical protein
MFTKIKYVEVGSMILESSRINKVLHCDSGEQTNRVGAKVFEKILESVIG